MKIKLTQVFVNFVVLTLVENHDLPRTHNIKLI